MAMERMAATGLTMPLPAMSGAEPAFISIVPYMGVVMGWEEEGTHRE